MIRRFSLLLMVCLGLALPAAARRRAVHPPVPDPSVMYFGLEKVE